ncbi:CPK1 [Symbiodinium natans]|uniref:non-specific serine/threonine protein kinase n=1 Tax=Symbiodinium natans TaxID=878477 RepID=A0A812I6V0_9DINO|nr:CPK1 [Symbiodinium natans]
MARSSESDTRSQPLSKSELLAACRGFQTGRRLQNRGYVQGKQLSCGATGEVFLGRVAAAACAEFGALPNSSSPASQVALKHMRAINAGVQRQIQQEISMVFQCRAKYAEEVGDPVSPGHPYFVAYLDWFAGPTGLDREVYLVMELCSFSLADMIFAAGNLRTDFEKSLAAQRRAYGHVSAGTSDGSLVVKILSDPGRFRFPEREVLQVLRNILSALCFLHRHGIAHRDVKCENILWAQGCYKLADFGTAVLLEDAAKRRDETGTLWIMAPELLGRRPYGLNCDVWSLGVVLFEVAALGKPFNSKELLAYRNSPEALAANSFWTFLLGTATGGTPTSSPSRSCKVIPSLPTHKSSRDVTRTNSNNSRVPPRKDKRSVTLPPLHREAFQAEECSSADALHERRRAFLKKRCSFRWIYSEELKNLVFEELLCEDTESRPSTAAIEERAALQSMADKAEEAEVPAVPPGAESPEELLRCMCAENMLQALASRKGRQTAENQQSSESQRAVSSAVTRCDV